MSTTNHKPIGNPDAIVQGEHWRLTVLTPGLVRIEYSPDGKFEDRASTFAINRQLPTPQFTASKTDSGGLELVTATLRLSYDGKPFTPNGLQAYGVFSHFVGDGCGGTPEWRYGQPDKGNMGGTARTLDFTSSKIDIGQGIISKNGISVLDDSDSMLFTDDGWFATREEGRKDLYLFCFGSDHREALKALYAVSGAPPVLPRWALGNWWSKYYPYKQDEYLALMDKFEKEKIPMSVAVVDMDWHLVDIPPEHGAGWTGYTWNKELFPDHVKFMSDLHNKDLKVTLNTHPVDGIRSYEESYERICKALGRDPAKGDPVHFDPTDRKFLEAYFTQVHHPLEDEGCDFWWMDWQQGKYSRTAGVDPLWMLNHYHFLDSQRKLGRRMGFSRFAGPGNQRYPIGFSGDTEILWSVLQFQPEFTAAAANIGFGWWSHDIGGHHHGINDDVLYSRWVQFGLFSPILRLHSNWNTTIVREPWLRGPECEKVVSECLRFRHRMIPYLYTMSVRATLEGRSLLEPMYYDHPSDNYAYRNKNHYLFGSEMIVAPITTPNVYATNMGSVECWLPPGRYVDLFTGSVYDGNRVITMHRPTSGIPVLAGAGSIIPLDASPKFANGAPIPSALEVIVTVGVDAEFTIKEDDGTAEDVEHIKFSNTPIKYDQQTGRLTIGPTENPLIAQRHWTIQLPAFPADHFDDVSVTVAGERAVLATEEDEDEKSFIITLRDAVPAESQIVVELGTGLRMRSPNLLQKVEGVVARAQIEHDTKWEILTHIKADISRAVRVSRIAATEMDPELRSALMEFILADDLSQFMVTEPGARALPLLPA